MITLIAARDLQEFQNDALNKAHMRMFELQAERVPTIIGYGKGPRMLCHGKNFYRLVPMPEKEFYALMKGSMAGSTDAIELAFESKFDEEPA